MTEPSESIRDLLNDRERAAKNLIKFQLTGIFVDKLDILNADPFDSEFRKQFVNSKQNNSNVTYSLI